MEACKDKPAKKGKDKDSSDDEGDGKDSDSDGDSGPSDEDSESEEGEEEGDGEGEDGEEEVHDAQNVGKQEDEVKSSASQPPKQELGRKIGSKRGKRTTKKKAKEVEREAGDTGEATGEEKNGEAECQIPLAESKVVDESKQVVLKAPKGKGKRKKAKQTKADLETEKVEDAPDAKVPKVGDAQQGKLKRKRAQKTKSRLESEEVEDILEAEDVEGAHHKNGKAASPEAPLQKKDPEANQKKAKPPSASGSVLSFFEACGAFSMDSLIYDPDDCDDNTETALAGKQAEGGEEQKGETSEEGNGAQESASYIVMNYKSRGTSAVRQVGGKQVCQVKVPGASLEQNESISKEAVEAWGFMYESTGV